MTEGKIVTWLKNVGDKVGLLLWTWLCRFASWLQHIACLAAAPGGYGASQSYAYLQQVFACQQLTSLFPPKLTVLPVG